MILIAVLAALLSSGNTLKEIKFTHGFQSSELNGGTVASNAFDGDLNTQSASLEENQPWLQLYFQNFTAVEKVVIEKGLAREGKARFKVEVWDGDNKTVCDSYTVDDEYLNQEVECGGIMGDSVRIRNVKKGYLNIYEMKAYGGTASCQAGWYWKDLSGCGECPEDTYSGLNATECTNCSKGEMAQPGSAECTAILCEAGWYDYEGCKECKAGEYSAANATECSQCGTGETSKARADHCFCRAGWYQTSVHLGGGCKECPAGYYSAANATECTACGTGETSESGADNCTKDEEEGNNRLGEIL